MTLRLLASAMAACAIALGTAANAETTVCDGGGAAGSGAGRINAVPFTISAPGVYCLTTKISSNLTSGAAITINANNVVLDLNGYAIGNLQAPSSTLATGIEAVDRQNITVRNGIVRGFWVGVGLFNGTTVGGTTALSSGHKIEGITADTSYLSGLAVQGPFAQVINNKVMNTKGSSITTSISGVLVTNYYGAGIMVSGADAYIAGNQILDTDCSNSCVSVAGNAAFAVGIFLISAPSSVVENNTISNLTLPTVYTLPNGSFAYGILIFQNDPALPASTNVFVINNQLMMWTAGIVFAPAASTTAAATGDIVQNGTQGIATGVAYIGGTNIDLANGMNF